MTSLLPAVCRVQHSICFTTRGAAYCVRSLVACVKVPLTYGRNASALAALNVVLLRRTLRTLTTHALLLFVPSVRVATTNRLLALREINQYAGSFDETGRKQLVRDIVASRVGHDIADRYIPRMEGPRQTSQSKVAMLENVALAAGNAVEVMSSEPHIEHLGIHVAPLQEHIAAIQTGEQDLGVLLPIASVMFEHVSAHMQFLAQDPTAQAEVAEMNQMMQIANEVITNFGRRFQKDSVRLHKVAKHKKEHQMLVLAPPSCGCRNTSCGCRWRVRRQSLRCKSVSPKLSKTLPPKMPNEP